MEIQVFKLRGSQDKQVRESFAPEFHLKQNSLNNAYINEEGNDFGLNDHITSARFNCPDENIELQDIKDEQRNNIIQNNPTPQSQYRYNQQSKQLKYQKKNIELQDQNSNGKQNLNSNGNYNTQRTNQSNQTLSEQFTNTVVKDRQTNDFLVYEDEKYQDKNTVNQINNHILKGDKQEHHHQVLMHQQQFSRQNYQQNMNQSNSQLQKRQLTNDIYQQQQEYEIKSNEIQEIYDKSENISDTAIKDEDNLNNNLKMKKNIIQQRKYVNQQIQQQQTQQCYKKQNNNQINQAQQQMDDYEEYNLYQDQQNDQYLNQFQLQQQMLQQQSKQSQKMQQQPYLQNKHNNISSHQSYPQNELQQLKQNTSDHNIQKPHYNNQQNIFDPTQDCHRQVLTLQNQYKDESINFLTNTEEQEDQIVYEDRLQNKQYQLNEQQQQLNNQKIGIQNVKSQRIQNGQSSFSPRYNKKNISTQQIDKYSIDEHSNNTSNNEDGIVNISSIKKKITSNMNTPVQSTNNLKISQTLLRENSNSQNMKKNSDHLNKQYNDQENNQDQTSQNINNSQQQDRKNNFYEDKENQYPNSFSSLNRIKRHHSHNQQQINIAKSNKSASPCTYTPQGNKSLNNSRHQFQQFQQQFNKACENYNMIDTSEDKKIKDLSYSVFVEGNVYLDEDVQSQNTSISNQNQQQYFLVNKENKQKPICKNNNYIQQKNTQNKAELLIPDIKFTEEQIDNYSAQNEQDDNFLEDQSQFFNNYYSGEYNQLQNSQHQLQKLLTKNNQNQINLTKQFNQSHELNSEFFIDSTVSQQVKGSSLLNEMNNKQQYEKNQIKIINTNQSTQSTSITFQTQGFTRESFGNKEILSNFNNVINEGNIRQAQENKLKINDKDQQQNTDSDLEQIEIEQILENEIDNQIQNEDVEQENQKNNKIIQDNKNLGQTQQINCRNSSKDGEGKTSNKFANISRQLFQPNKEEFNDIYNLLQHERNKNNSLEEKLCSKQQTILSFQKTTQKITKENDLLKSDIDKKTQKINNLEKDIKILEDIQRKNKDSEEYKDLVLEKEKLQSYQDIILNENKILNSQKEIFEHQIQQLQEYNSKLENELKKLTQKNKDLTHEFQQKNILLTQQIENITIKKNEEIGILQKSLIKIQKQENERRKYDQYQFESSLCNNQKQFIKKQLVEKGSLCDTMNTSSTQNDTSMNQSFQGQPPRKNSIPSSQSQYNSKTLQNTNNYKQNTFDQQLKNQNSSNNNNKIPSSEVELVESQNYRKGRSSSVSYQDSEQQSQPNQINNITNVNTISQQQQYPNHQYSGSFSHSSNFYIPDKSQRNSPISQNFSQTQQINFSINELMKILNLRQESEIIFKVKEILDQNKNTKQFVNCVLDMVQKCDPSEFFTNKKPDLKQSWVILKQIMNKYLQLKMKIVKDQVDSDIIDKVQSYLQVSDKEKIVTQISNLQTDNQKLTKIISFVKKNFNLEWVNSLYELEKAIEMENSQFNKQNTQKQNRNKVDNLLYQPQHTKFNEQVQTQQQSHSNTFQNRGQDIQQHTFINQNSSYSPHMRNHTKKQIAPLQTNDYNLFQGQQIQNLHGLTTSSKRMNSANSNKNNMQQQFLI